MYVKFRGEFKHLIYYFIKFRENPLAELVSLIILLPSYRKKIGDSAVSEGFLKKNGFDP